MSSDYERLFIESRQGEPVIMSNNKICGHIIGKKYIKQVHKEHFMTTPPAIAIDKSVFAQHIQPNCDRIFILNVDTGEFYSSSVSNFLKHSFHLDRKFGEQYAMGMEFWSRNFGVIHQAELPI